MKHLYFYHMRKCGGTTILNALKQYAKHQVVRLTWDEGYRFGNCLYPATPIEEVLQEKSSLLDGLTLVTHFRNPVDRVFSVYLEEWKMSRIPRDKKIRTFVEENITNSAPLFYHLVTSNYFIKSLLDHGGEVGQEHFDLALELLQHFQCIYVLDRNLVIKESGFPNIHLGYYNKKSDEDYRGIREEIGELSPMVQELNYWDLKLYHHFCDYRGPKEFLHVSNGWRVLINNAPPGFVWRLPKLEFRYRSRRRGEKVLSSGHPAPIGIDLNPVLEGIAGRDGVCWIEVHCHAFAGIDRLHIRQEEAGWYGNIEIQKKTAKGNWETMQTISGIGPDNREIFLDAKQYQSYEVIYDHWKKGPAKQ